MYRSKHADTYTLLQEKGYTHGSLRSYFTHFGETRYCIKIGNSYLHASTPEQIHSLVTELPQSKSVVRGRPKRKKNG